MALTYTFPTNHELTEVAKDFVIQPSQFIGEKILPFNDVNTQRVEWDSEDDEAGMTAPHALDSDPKVVERPGSKLLGYEPLHFKESEMIKESELLKARQLGTLNGTINIDELVMRRLGVRMNKDRVRAEWIRWQSLLGGFSINENGVVANEAFDVQVFNPVVDWNDNANSTILGDLEAMSLMFEGVGATAQGAMIYMNRRTLNQVLANTNNSDLAAFRNANFRNTNYSIAEANELFEKRGIPQIALYDEGYKDKDGVYHHFIPTGKAVLVGQRTGSEKVGDFILTPSLHKESGGMPAPGFFALITVNGHASAGNVGVVSLGQKENPNVKITSGFYGGPRFKYAKSVIKCNLY